MPALRRQLIVDGYNVIRSSDRYRELVDQEILDPLAQDVYVRAREALVSDVAAFAKGRFDTTVVFDGAGNLNPERPVLKTAGIAVVFSEEGEEADAVIERMVHESRSKGRPVTLVTSDHVVRDTAWARGVTLMSARLFVRESRQLRTDVQACQRTPVSTHSTVAQRVPPDVREKLWRMARGLDIDSND